MKRLRSQLTKNIFGTLLIIGCSGFFLNGYVGVSEVHATGEVVGGSAQNNTTSTSSMLSFDTTSIWEILNMVLKVIYLLLWPLLVVAGLALDNTLVYASVFHLDAPLWKFWNMMKNFANFALGFMVLFSIIKSILSNSGAGSAKDQKSPLGIIKTTLIAGVLIQASWFLVAAVVDISTIATYAVGGLPLSVLKNTNIGDQKILSVNSQLDLNEFELTSAGGKEFQVWYSTKHPLIGGDKIVTMSPCRVERSYVIGREYGDPKYKNSTKFTGTAYVGLEVCVLYGNQLVMWPEDKFIQTIKDTLAITVMGPLPDYTTEVGYSYYMNTLLNMTGWDTTGFVTQNLVYLASGTSAFTTGNAFFGGTDSMTISSLIQKSKGFVGPLVTIYSSLLNFAQLSNTNVTTTSGTSGIFIIKALVAIALFFPLIALALVLIMRIGVLWLYIVASPFIILKASFKDFIKIKGLDDYLSIQGVMGIIFAPVVTVAALSISLIFMTALVNGFTSNDTNSAINQTLGIEKIKAQEIGNDAISFGGIAQLEFSKLPWGEAMDRFSRLMVNFFAIGLMWMIVFAAIKANKIGEGVGQKVQDFGENVFQTLPILPAGGGMGGVGIGSAAKVLTGVPDKWIQDRESEATQKARDWVYGKEEGTIPTTITTTQANDFIKIGATQQSIEKAVQDLGVKESDIGTVLTASTANLYEAINRLPDTPQRDRETIIAAIATKTGLGAGWYNKEAANAAKKNIDTTVNGIPNSSNDTEVTALLNRPENKILIEKYFDNTDEPYKQIIGNRMLTITKPTVAGANYTPVLTNNM